MDGKKFYSSHPQKPHVTSSIWSKKTRKGLATCFAIRKDASDSTQMSTYGGVQCYLSQRCGTRIIAGDKHLSKNILDDDLTIYHVSKYLCVDMAICDIQKYFMLI